MTEVKFSVIGIPSLFLIRKLSAAIWRRLILDWIKPENQKTHLKLKKSQAAVEIEAWPEGKLRRPVRISDASVALQAGFGPGHWYVTSDSFSIISSDVRLKHLKKPYTSVLEQDWIHSVCKNGGFYRFLHKISSRLTILLNYASKAVITVVRSLDYTADLTLSIRTESNEGNYSRFNQFAWKIRYFQETRQGEPIYKKLYWRLFYWMHRSVTPIHRSEFQKYIKL